MSRDDDPPELAGYVPSEGRPLRHPATIRVMRVVIVLGVIGFVVPSAWATWALQQRMAAVECAALVARTAPDAEPVAHFELAGPEGPAWYCSARVFDGDELLLGSLGLIPG